MLGFMTFSCFLHFCFFTYTTKKYRYCSLRNLAWCNSYNRKRFFTLKNTGCEKKHVMIFCMILLTMIVSLFTSNKKIDSGLYYAIVCYFSLYWLIALNNHFSFAEREKNTIFRFCGDERNCFLGIFIYAVCVL